jgi:hypothetical protein
MYTQDIMCPKCGKPTTVNVPDGKGTVKTPCSHKFWCGKTIVVVTDSEGRVVEIKGDGFWD